MARHYTSAQLTMFRSALALLEDGILQGDLDVADQKYIDVTDDLISVSAEAVVSDQVAEISEATATKTTLSAETESSKTKAKSIFPWFSKKKHEVAAVPPVDLSRIKVDPVPAIAEKVVAKVEVVVPALEVVKPALPPDTRIVGSFFAGLPWAFKKESSGLVSSVQGVPAQAKNLSSDHRIVSSFFPALPWLQKPNEAGSLPKQEQATNAITIDRKGSADDSGILGNKSVLVTEQYFSGLPWAVKGQVQPAQYSTDLEADSPTQPDIANTSPTNVALIDYKLQVAGSFFANVPWLKSNDISGSGQSDTLNANQGAQIQQVGQMETVQVVNLSIPLDEYFPTVPWHGQGASKNTDSASATGSSAEAMPSIFAAATQSALHASRKDKKHRKSDEK